jgi:hypothetical protein
VKKTTKVQIGARALGPKKTETLDGRKQNQEHKANFKQGAFAKETRGPNGSLLTPHQNATPPAAREGSTDVTK